MRKFNNKTINRLGWAGTGRHAYREFPGQYPYRIAFRYYPNMGSRPQFLYIGKPTTSAYKKIIRHIRKNMDQLIASGSNIQYTEFIQNGIILSGNISLRNRTVSGQCVPNYQFWKFLGHGVHPVEGRMHIDFADEVVPFRNGKHTVMVGLPHIEEDEYKVVDGKHIAVKTPLIVALKNCVRTR